MKLSHKQLRILAIVERSASALSILGVVTIIGTFSLSRQFRSPTHRIILINAFYNLFDFMATMISVSGPEAGDESALCKFQAFSLQMFPVADVLWTLAMAWNVFLVVFYRYEPEDLRRLEKKYIGIISTVTFIPALVFLFIHTPERGPMYGSVTLWCAISPKWVLYRIIFYYGPIWFIILVVMALYIIVGIEIIKLRNEFPLNNEDCLILSSTVSESNDSLPRDNSTAKAIQASLARKQSAVSLRKYLLMPLFFFLALLTTWVTPSINRISAFRYPNQEQYPLLLAVGAMGSLRGFWNGLIFISMRVKGTKR